MNEPTEPDLREPDNPAAWALASHIADHPVSTIQAAFRYLNAPLTIELHDAPAPAPAGPAPATDRAKAIADAIGPTMLLGLQDAELFDEPGQERIRDWIKWISETVAALPAMLPALTDQSAAERDSLGREADRLRKDWVEMRTRAERAEAELRRLAGEAPVTPPPALTEEGRLRAQVEVLQQDAERDQGLAKVGARCMREGHQGLIEQGRAVIEGHRFALSVKLDLGTGAPWDAIHERVAELRRLAGEAQQEEPPCCSDPTCTCVQVNAAGRCDCAKWDDAPAREAQQDPTEDGEFVPPAAMGLPAGTLEAAEIGANRLDAWARTPYGRNFLAHALVQLARTGWLRTEPGEGFEPGGDRDDIPEPQDPTAVARPGQLVPDEETRRG